MKATNQPSKPRKFEVRLRIEDAQALQRLIEKMPLVDSCDRYGSEDTLGALRAISALLTATGIPITRGQQ